MAFLDKFIKTPTLRICMLGPRAVGKTTVLTSVFADTQNDLAGTGLFFRYKTGSASDRLINYKKQLQLCIECGDPGKLPASGDISQFDFEVGYANRVKTNVLVKDYPGEYLFDESKKHYVTEFLSESNVVLIAIDTPYLMDNSETMCDAVNCISDIHNSLTNINDQNGTKAKMVVFVPIKCEKWVMEGRIKEVVDKLKSAYRVPIQALSAYNKMSICILPIETAGNILFREFREAFLLNGNSKDDRCCQLSDKMVRMGDGSTKPLKTDDILNPDFEAVMGTLGIPRPYSWFYTNNRTATPGYAPRNCDQLALHILKFYVQKFQKENAWPNWMGWAGFITREEMLKKMAEINAANIIKNDVDGIEYLKKAY